MCILIRIQYNTRCNGLCKKVNGILKIMKKKTFQERQYNYDRYLQAILSAYWEVLQVNMKFDADIGITVDSSRWVTSKEHMSAHARPQTNWRRPVNLPERAYMISRQSEARPWKEGQELMFLNKLIFTLHNKSIHDICSKVTCHMGLGRWLLCSPIQLNL